MIKKTNLKSSSQFKFLNDALVDREQLTKKLYCGCTSTRGYQFSFFDSKIIGLTFPTEQLKIQMFILLKIPYKTKMPTFIEFYIVVFEKIF